MVLFSLTSNDLFEIKYEYTQKLEIGEEMRRAYPPEILDQIREASNQSYMFSMITNKEESIIKLLPMIINTQSKLGVEIEPDLKWSYKNLSDNYVVNLVDINKKYYVKDSMQRLAWNRTNEEKELLGFRSQKYFYEDENQIFEIWCANEIDIPNGPLNYSGNNKLILESTISNKKGVKLSYHFMATEINQPPKFNFSKEKPKKIISKEKFDALVSNFRKKEQGMKEGIDKD